MTRSEAENRISELEAQVRGIKEFSQYLWRFIRADIQKLMVDDFDYEGRRITDAAFDAAEAVKKKHHIYIEPVAPL